MANGSDRAGGESGTTEPMSVDSGNEPRGREWRFFRCLGCHEKLYTLGKIAEPDVWAKRRGDPDLHTEGNVAYMICPKCGAKNGFTEAPTTTGRGFRLTHLIE